MYVVIGKFSPLHDGHQKLIDKLLEKDNVTLLIGSINKIDHRNFLTYKEKLDIVGKNGYYEMNTYLKNMKYLNVGGLYDYDENDKWVEHVINKINKMGYKKDDTIKIVTGNPYVKSLLFPHYEIINPSDVISADEMIDINASTCRYEISICKDHPKEIKGLSKKTLDYLINHGIIKRMIDMYDKKLYEGDLRDSIFETVDDERKKRGN